MTTINLSLKRHDPGKYLSIKVPLGTVAVGTNTLTADASSGTALNQWNVNFFTRFPSPYGSHKNGYHSIASFTPRTTMFQLAIQHVTPIRSA